MREESLECTEGGERVCIFTSVLCVSVILWERRHAKFACHKILDNCSGLVILFHTLPEAQFYFLIWCTALKTQRGGGTFWTYASRNSSISIYNTTQDPHSTGQDMWYSHIVFSTISIYNKSCPCASITP